MLAQQLWTKAGSARTPALGLIVLRNGGAAAVIGCGAAKARTDQFRYGSITKTVTALTALTLLRDQPHSLQTPVSALLPAPLWHNPWSASRPLRVQHLLELTAGLPDLTRAEWDSAQPLTLRQALAIAPDNRRLQWPAGLQHSYSNASLGITQSVIAALAGRPFEDAADTQVLAPLGMHTASFRQAPMLVGGFRADGVTAIDYWHMTYAAFGALNASLTDMARLLRWLAQQSQQWQGVAQPALPDPLQFTAQERAALFTTQTTAGARAGLTIGYGAGIYSRIYRGAKGSKVFWGHGGDADGYRSRYGIDPRSGDAYLVVINTDNPRLLRRLVDQLEAQLGEVRAPLPSRSWPESVDLTRLTGRYYPGSARFAVDRWRSGTARTAAVVLRDDRLWFQRGDTRSELLWHPGGRDGAVLARRRGDPLATIAFVPGRGVMEQSLLLQGELGNFVRLEAARCPPIFPFCNSQ